MSGGEGERRSNGQFGKGQSGNASGARARRRKVLLTPEDFHRAILQVAASPTELKINGTSTNGTFLDANVWGLASGRSVNRLASKDFLELTRGATYFFERLEKRQPKTLDEPS